MDIANNIRRLRLRGELTQEELAARINCSPQAVSRWERGECYPEMTLIPIIANIFGVTTDELFGMDEARKQERMNEYKQKIIEIARSGVYSTVSHETGIHHVAFEGEDRMGEIAALAKAAIREFAGDFEAEISFAGHLGHKNTDAIIRIYERVLERCTDDLLRITARSRLAHILADKGETERAIELARALPGIKETFRHALMYITRGREHLRHAQDAFIEAVSIAGSMLAAMIYARDENGEEFFGADERLKLCEKLLLLDDLRDTQSQHGLTEYIHRYGDLAQKAMAAGQHERALGYLEKSAYCADESRDYTPAWNSPLYSEWPKPDEASMNFQAWHGLSVALSQVLKQLSPEYCAKYLGLSSADELDPESEDHKWHVGLIRLFDPVRDNPRFIAVLERLSALEAEYPLP